MFERNFNLLVLSVLCALVLWGSLLNDRGIKYSRIFPRDTNSLPKPFHNCLSSDSSQYKPSLVVGLNLPNSFVCCNSARKDDLLCVSSNDSSIRWLSSSWAWIIPFFPLLFTFLAELIEYCIPNLFQAQPSVPFAAGNYKSNDDWVNPLLVMLKENNINKFYAICLKTVFRAMVYFLIILIRAYVLYLAPFYLLEVGLDSGWLDNSLKCWCPHLVSTRKCQLPFDFSDHIVLCVVQYIFPTLLEISYLLRHKLTAVNYSNSTHNNNVLMNTSTTPYSTSLSSHKPSANTTVFSWRSIYLLPFLFALLFLWVNLRLIFYTTIFFHTPSENLVGLLIAAGCCFPFLLSIKSVMIWLRLTS